MGLLAPPREVVQAACSRAGKKTGEGVGVSGRVHEVGAGLCGAGALLLELLEGLQVLELHQLLLAEEGSFIGEPTLLLQLLLLLLLLEERRLGRPLLRLRLRLSHLQATIHHARVT